MRELFPANWAALSRLDPALEPLVPSKRGLQLITLPASCALVNHRSPLVSKIFDVLHGQSWRWKIEKRRNTSQYTRCDSKIYYRRKGEGRGETTRERKKKSSLEVTYEMWDIMYVRIILHNIYRVEYNGKQMVGRRQGRENGGNSEKKHSTEVEKK